MCSWPSISRRCILWDNSRTPTRSPWTQDTPCPQQPFAEPVQRQGHLQRSRAMQTGCVLINNVHSCSSRNTKLHFQSPGSLSQSPLPAQDIYLRFLLLHPTYLKPVLAQTGLMPFLMKLIFSPSSDFSFNSLFLTNHPAFIIICQKYSTKKPKP